MIRKTTEYKRGASRMRQYETFEVTLKGPELTESDNQAQADVTGVFSLRGKETRVKGFYDGSGIYKVRFLPEEAGICSYKISGTVSAAGTEECLPAENRHGKVKTEGTHFIYEDGSAFYPFGTTVYALAHQDDKTVEQTLATLSKAPFNKIRMCVFPKHYDFNQNEPPYFAFEKKKECRGVPETEMMQTDVWDAAHPSFSFWHRFEDILKRISELGIETDLILFHPYDRWGFSKLPMEDNLMYLDYLLRRLSAFPQIWWSLANEYDLMEAREPEDWVKFADFITENDSFHHLMSIHHCLVPYDFSNPDLSHSCIQSRTVSMAGRLIRKYGKPCIFDEMCYEGNIMYSWGNISAREMTDRFWCVCASGAYGTHGETFLSDDDVLWWAKGGVLKGESPLRIGWLKNLLYSLPGALESEANAFETIDFMEKSGRLTEDILASVPEGARHFIRTFTKMNQTERQRFFDFNPSYSAHVKDRVFLYYFSKECPAETVISLPLAGHYRVEALDAWNMTRVLLMEKADVQKADGFNPFGSTSAEEPMGTCKIKLPGREYMAVLAVKIEE